MLPEQAGKSMLCLRIKEGNTDVTIVARLRRDHTIGLVAYDIMALSHGAIEGIKKGDIANEPVTVKVSACRRHRTLRRFLEPKRFCGMSTKHQ